MLRPDTRTPHRRMIARRRLTVASLFVCIVALLVVLAGIAVQLFWSSARPFVPSSSDGLIEADQPVSLDDSDVPAIARLDQALLDAMRQAQSAALSSKGLEFTVTSGWRNSDYQRWIFDDAVARHGITAARKLVSTPEESSHVTGDAIDIGPIDAQFWLISYGYEYGICQTYANERWHFELATEPGGECPMLALDASGAHR